MDSVEDKRRSYRFCVDDAVLDVFGPRIGAYGIAVYTLLARHAKLKQAFPSYATITKKLGMSRRGVIYAMNTLIEVGLVQKQARRSDDGDPTSNLYILVDLSAYHDHPTWEVGGGAYGAPPSAQDALPGAYGAPGVVHMVHQGGAYGAPKGFSLKGSQIEGSEDPPIYPPEGDALPMNGAVPTGKTRPNYSPGFIRFWDCYPHARRVSKPTCFKVWKRAKLEPRTEEVCSLIEAHKQLTWNGQVNYIPTTMTWLNQGRYDDDLPVPATNPKEWDWVKAAEEQEARRATS